MPSDCPDATDLIARSHAGLAPLADRLAALDARLSAHCDAPAEAIAAKARKLRRKIRDFEPGVTMIGQVKAGKTTLVNAMTGWGGLLPADVNPWTSVVTSLHLRPGPRRVTENARFQFFTEEEWTHLVQRGGRMGELAGRAGAEDEMEKVRRQLEEMREKSRQRLGRRFEMMLGQAHDYDAFDADLIERYVCLGDDFWDEAGTDRAKGRFADITRAADLWLRQPELPLALCLRDTPGVNDTFMIREQITINTLRGSRLCVVVLAATQALTTVDLALIRLISNVKARDLVIFVNRIDELGDPAREIPQIRDSIRQTLKDHEGPDEAEIVFGCGHWAGKALDGGIEALGVGSAGALLNLAEAAAEKVAFASVEELVWHLSGVETLGRAIAERIEAGPGAELEREIAVELGNLDRAVAAADRLDAAPDAPGGACRMPPEAIGAALSRIEGAAQERLKQGLAPLRAGLAERAQSARRTFVTRATSAAVKHLDAHGALDAWTYDPSGLRVLLRSGFQRHVRGVARLGEECLAEAAEALSALYAEAFGVTGDAALLEPPPLPPCDPPVVLGQTIALDLRGSWWRRFWLRRRGADAYAADFERLIHEETQPILDALVQDHAQGYEAAVAEALGAFVTANARILADLSRPGRDAAPSVPHAGTFSANVTMEATP